MSSPDSRPSPRIAGFIPAVTGVLLALEGVLFAAWANRSWEDWWITYRASRHLALGEGLVFTPGERVHSFTSPLGTLIPAALCAVTGCESDALVLWLFRLVSVVATGIAAWLLGSVVRDGGARLGALVFLGALLLLDIKTVDFSTNGMETGLMVLAVAITVDAATRAPLDGRRLGVAWALLMWTRPDGFVYAGALAAAVLAFPPEGTTRTALLRTMVRAGLWCAVLYGPWFAWAAWYYGTPVPHTVVAKSLGTDRSFITVMTRLVIMPWNAFFGENSLKYTFLPTYYMFGGFEAVVPIGRALAILAGFYWLVPRASPPARRLSLAFLVVHVYLSTLVPVFYPWYFPMCAWLGIAVLAWCFHDALTRFTASMGQLLALSAVVIVVVVQAFTMVSAAHMLHVQQRVIETGNRLRIGQYLKTHAAPGDTVLLEPLGYIGYFSGLKMYDYPGLSSPEMVAARRERPGGYFGWLIERLQPTWVVLRPHEAMAAEEEHPGILKENYALVERFDVHEAVEAEEWLPGRNWLLFDSIFLVFHRKSAPAASAP